MADWVHCNLCFHQPGDGRKFFLTNCGHMYCESCVNEGTSDKCKMCGNPCSAITLSSQMKPEVEMFFTDPTDLVKKQQRQLLQVMDFQKNHRQRLTAYMKEKNKKQNTLMEDARRKLDQWEDFEREILILKEENANLRRLLGGSPASKLTYRAKSPGKGLSPSQMKLSGRTPSPSQHSHNSPFAVSRGNHPSTPQNSGGDAQSSQVVTGVQYTPKGPSRITMRTPPVDGKMGTPPTPVRNIQQQTPTSHMLSRQNNPTPGSYETPNRSMISRTSPMSVSPASRITSISDTSHGKDGPYIRTTPKNQQTPTQGYHTPSSQSVPNTWDPSKRRIHLISYQPQRPVLSAALSDPSKQNKK